MSFNVSPRRPISSRAAGTGSRRPGSLAETSAACLRIDSTGLKAAAATP